MGGRLVPVMASVEQVIQVAHRGLAVAVLLLVAWMAWAVRRDSDNAVARRLALLAVLLVLVQVALGAANVWSRLSAFFVVPHLAVGAALFATCVWLFLAAMREPAGARSGALSGGRDPGRREPGELEGALRTYVALTKPRIIELLLVTTIPTMVLAQQTVEPGLPSIWLMAAVIIGGTMAAGGANAINQFIDRDIDDVMRRTRHRPLPRHAVAPRSALLFGIVFYWTPPHFWALAMRYKGDYETARVPMMPVVRGEAETARQIVLYALLLVAVSLILFPAAEMGLIYLVSALLLGAAFVWYSLRLLRNVTDGRAAIGLFRFSISYLTLLFAAVAIDSLFRLAV
jgi:heme O synthase-like polyprenyltransferase